MKIIINAKNADKLNSALKDVQGRATARTITADDIIKAAERITRNIGIAKVHLVGCAASVDVWAKDFPRTYKYTPESTQFEMVYTSTGWAVTSIHRSKTRGLKQGAVVMLTAEAQAEIIKNVSTMSSNMI